MDKKIERNIWTANRIWVAIILIIAISALFYSFFSTNESSLKVEKDKITVAKVTTGVFQEYVPRTGTILPIMTQYIDSQQKGSIKKIYQESGAYLKKDDVILELSNPDLELDVMRQEASLYEQLSILRNSRLQLDQHNLNQKSQLAEINYQLSILKPQNERYKVLFEKDLVAYRQFEEIKNLYEYNLKRKFLFAETHKNDSIARNLQLAQMQHSEKSMLMSLEAVRNMLDNLVIRAPQEGFLVLEGSTLEESGRINQFQVGQTIASGQRIGQVDQLDNFRVRVPIEEHYLPRVDKGQKGSCYFDNQKFKLTLTKIYPTIQNGLFEVDMEFTQAQPTGIKSGQSLRIHLELSNSNQAVLLPSGGFFNSSGGNWVYVVDSEGKAQKRQIKLGRKNPEFYEVLNGLDIGEKVVISAYDSFGDNDILLIK